MHAEVRDHTVGIGGRVGCVAVKKTQACSAGGHVAGIWWLVRGPARNAGFTDAPRLTNAIPDYPKPPEIRSVLERVYKFSSGDQEAVFASAPTPPPGPTSTDTAYSPLSLAYLVRWKDRAHARSLTSEEAILAAADQNDVSVERTTIVINCPIIWTERGGVLPHSIVTR